MQNRDELPDYKQTFLHEMDILRHQEPLDSNLEQTKSPFPLPPNQPQPLQNNIMNSSQYSSSQWRQALNQTTTQHNHGPSHFELNLLMNPQIAKKQNNIRSTQISQYSNARHNNTVFVNPKNTSC